MTTFHEAPLNGPPQEVGARIARAMAPAMVSVASSLTTEEALQFWTAFLSYTLGVIDVSVGHEHSRSLFRSLSEVPNVNDNGTMQ